MPKANHIAILTTALLLGALPVHADGKGHGKRGGDWQDDGRQGQVVRGCPPGLAKKNPPCIPPGHARKYMREVHHPHVYRRGDYLPDDAIYLQDPGYYGLPDGSYFVDNGRVYRVNPQTLEVMALIGLVERLLN